MIMGEKVAISICYLGRRGGGPKITLQIFQDLKYSKIFTTPTICIRRDNELLKRYDQSSLIVLFEDLLSIKTFSKIILYVLAPKKLLKDMGLSRGGFCLIPMISPLGLVIENILKLQGVTVIRLLHDFERHPGDRWPPNMLIRRIIKRSTFLIALSNGVASKITNLNPLTKVSVYPHPLFEFSSSEASREYSRKYILFIGRIRKYKGIKNLVSAFSLLQLESMDLVIAGEGKIQQKEDLRIKLINRWLEESEIHNLIKHAEVIVFPYVEASQSGLLPYCTNLNKKIVATPLPGLLEQVASYPNAFITNDFEIDSLAESLRVAVSTEVAPKRSATLKSINIELCILESGLFPIK